MGGLPMEDGKLCREARQSLTPPRPGDSMARLGKNRYVYPQALIPLRGQRLLPRV